MKYQLNITYLVILYNFQASGDDERNFINGLASKNKLFVPWIPFNIDPETVSFQQNDSIGPIWALSVNTCMFAPRRLGPVFSIESKIHF